ncbi:MAG: O-antigen ligase family protein [Roseburia sp.]|nr:O-antigen ligase family protein [Roseburia sp.]
MAKKLHSKKNQPAKPVTQFQYLYLVPVLLLFLIFPFLAQYSTIPNPLTDLDTYYADPLLSDIFLHVKMKFLIFIGISMLCVFILDLLMNLRTQGFAAKDYKIFIPLGIYGIFVALSSIFSENKQLVLDGMPGQFETLWVLLMYLVLCLFGYWYFTTVQEKHMLLYIILVGALLMGGLFLMQFCGYDPYVEMFTDKNATVAVAGVYGGFFNPNYAGTYVSLLLPVLVAFAIGFRKNRIVCILSGVAVVLTLIGLYGSQTTGGYIGILVAAAFALLFLLFKKLQLSATKCFVTFGALVLAAVIGISLFITNASESKRYYSERLEYIYTNDDCVEVCRNGITLYIRAQFTDTNFYLTCTDEAGEIVATKVEGNTYYMDDARYALFTVTPMAISNMDNIVAFRLDYEYNSWYFTNDTDDGTYYLITSGSKLAKITSESKSEGVLFDQMPSFLSGRGYIWSRSIPMLADTLLLGYGPDNYAVHFPNEDYISALAGGFHNTFVSKPHNMYLQIAIQTGVPSLLAFLAFYLLYFVKSVKLYLTAKFDRLETYAGFGLFLGTIGYIVIGFINDSNLSVAPLFWFLLGTGVAINHHLSKES